MTRIAALMTGLALVLLPASVAEAGGPTSVLLASPDFNRTASLYHSDPLYERLQSLVFLADESKGMPGTDGWSDTNAHAKGPLIRATWLAHDMHVWRIDRIYPKSPGGPWIATSLHDSTKPMTDDKVLWHRASDPRGLLQVLGQLQMLDRTVQKTVPAPVPEEPAPITPVASAQTPGALTGWRWSLVGLAVGVLVTVAAFRLVRRQVPSSRIELLG